MTILIITDGPPTPSRPEVKRTNQASDAPFAWLAPTPPIVQKPVTHTLRFGNNEVRLKKDVWSRVLVVPYPKQFEIAPWKTVDGNLTIHYLSRDVAGREDVIHISKRGAPEYWLGTVYDVIRFKLRSASDTTVTVVVCEPR